MNRPLKTRLSWLLLASMAIACLLAIRSVSYSTVPDGLHSMPPHPASVDPPLGVNEAPPDLSDRLSKGIDAPNYIPHPPSGDFNLLVVLVDFADKQAVVNPEDFDELFFDTFNSHSVADYYSEISYGSLSLATVDMPSLTAWITASHSYNGPAGYVNADGMKGTSDDYGWGAFPQNLQGIVADIIPMIDTWVDFSQYDNDGDGFVDGVVFVHAGGAAELSLSPGDIWSAAWDMSSGNGPGSLQTEDGVSVDDFVFGPEYLVNPGDATIGVFAHELGHMLFGLPDLYDMDLSSYGVGSWSLMSFGAWNGSLMLVPGLGWVSSGDSPAWPDAWTRMHMGFDIPQTFVQNTETHVFAPVEDGAGNVVKLHSPALGANEYFLVEYRAQNGFDADLPGEGLLVWHVDETKWNRWGLNQVECAGSPCCACQGDHPLLALEQADGDFDLESRANSGDADDPFPGPGNRDSFNAQSIPESGSYNADVCPQDSCIGVEEIDISAGVITADLNVVCQAPGACVDLQADRMLGWGDAGGYATYAASIQNCGNADDTLTLTSQSTWLAQFFDLESGEPVTSTIFDVPDGGTLALGITVTVPADALWSTEDVLSLTLASANDTGISSTLQIATTVPYCTLVVDDDRSAPDVEGAYVNSLVGAGFDFDLWDTQVQGSPDEQTLAAHKAVLWFTGTPISNTLDPQDEFGLMSYLDGGGGLFFSSQEYLTDTLRDYFGRQYLRVSTFIDNAGVQVVSGVPGNPLSDSLGPYTLSITASLSDQVTPLSPALSAFTDGSGITNAITYDPGAWRTLFLGWPFEHLAQADGEELMAATLSWLQIPPRPLVDFEPSSLEVCEGQPITFTNTSSYASSYLWGFGDGLTSTLTDTTHVYSAPLTATVALTGTNCCGYSVVTETITIHDTPRVEFTPSAEIIYVYQEVEFTPVSTDTIVLSYTWDFGDGTEESRDDNPTHQFTQSGWYTVTLTIQGKQCAGITSKSLYVSPLIYLPLTLNQPDWNVWQPDLRQGNKYIWAAISTLALGFVLQRPFKRR